MKRPLRFVLATPICDGHDAAIVAVARLLRQEGAEAVYLGFNKTPGEIVKAAAEEDADAIAVSTYNGGHVAFLRDVIKARPRHGIDGLPVFCGGGGTILETEVAPLLRMGVAAVYRPPADLTGAVRDMITQAGRLRRARPQVRTEADGAARLARELTRTEWGGDGRRAPTSPNRSRPAREPRAAPRLWGINGRGGAGKSTILDELIERYLRRLSGSVAILSVDPTLADRVRMLHCYSPRVFLRSVGLGPGEAVAPKVPALIDRLGREPFELIFVESVGLGQNDLGVAPYVDASIFCMTPDYGSNLQLEKEALLSRCEAVVMNKRDWPQAEARARRVRAFLRPEQAFFLTSAKDHADPALDELFDWISERSGLRTTARPRFRRAGSAFAPLPERGCLGGVVEAHEAYYAEMEREAKLAEADPEKGREVRRRLAALWAAHGFRGLPEPGDASEVVEGSVLWRLLPDGERVPVARRTTCDLWVPVLGLPPLDASPAEIVRYFYKQNVPGSFPFTEGAFARRRTDESPIRMFAGLGLPETTNARFHLLAQRGGQPRLSTAFDSLTLYGLDSDEPGALAKVGEGGVAVDTIEDMIRLYDGFDLEKTSVSLTMSGPAPTILAMYLAAARRRGFDLKQLHGTIQTDIFKEVQAQNEAVFPLEPSLRLIGDMFETVMREAPLWYPISISGYHMHEAGANPVQELAFTLANGFTYLDMMRRRGLPAEEVARRFSFFLTAGSELEFHVLGRVARRLWAVGSKRYFGLSGPGLRLKFHSQTSGRTLQDVEPLHNLARVTIQAERALHNNANSLHTNSYKETYTTPEEDDVLLAMGCQQIPLLESGDFKFIENLHQGSFALGCLEDAVEQAVLRIFREIDQQGGVVAAIENEYFRGMIQEEVLKAHRAVRSGERPVIGLNYLKSDKPAHPRGRIVHIPMADKRRQVARTRRFKRRHARAAEAALERLKATARGDGNVFAELMNTVEAATVGQITRALWDVWGRFRPSM